MEILAVLLGIVAGGGAVYGLLRVRGRRALGGGSSTARSSTRIDPFAVGEPWRRYVAGAQSAHRRFNDIVATLPSGPLRTSMADIGRRVVHSVDECWQIAQRGHQLDATLRQLDASSVRARLERSTDEASRGSLQGQLDSIDRIRTARDQTDERLRSLQVRLGELVSRAAEVSTGVDLTAELGSAVDDVVIQLEALGQAVDEVNNTGRSAGFELGGPGTASPTT